MRVCGGSHLLKQHMANLWFVAYKRWILESGWTGRWFAEGKGRRRGAVSQVVKEEEEFIFAAW